jgi:hypothetical protein
MSGSGERPEMDVRIRVLIGLTKQPKGAPMLAKLSQRNGQQEGHRRRCCQPSQIGG